MSQATYCCDTGRALVVLRGDGFHLCRDEGIFITIQFCPFCGHELGTPPKTDAKAVLLPVSHLPDEDVRKFKELWEKVISGHQASFTALHGEPTCASVAPTSGSRCALAAGHEGLHGSGRNSSWPTDDEMPEEVEVDGG